SSLAFCASTAARIEVNASIVSGLSSCCCDPLCAFCCFSLSSAALMFLLLLLLVVVEERPRAARAAGRTRGHEGTAGASGRRRRFSLRGVPSPRFATRAVAVPSMPGFRSAAGPVVDQAVHGRGQDTGLTLTRPLTRRASELEYSYAYEIKGGVMPGQL